MCLGDARSREGRVCRMTLMAVSVSGGCQVQRRPCQWGDPDGSERVRGMSGPEKDMSVG